MDRLKAEWDEATSAIGSFEAEQVHTLELMKRSESQMQRSALPQDKKEALAHEINAYKRRLADQAARQSELRAAEAQAAAEHRAALVRIAELDEQLSWIERGTDAVVK